jgi:hypothetical protein
MDSLHRGEVKQFALRREKLKTQAVVLDKDGAKMLFTGASTTPCNI